VTDEKAAEMLHMLAHEVMAVTDMIYDLDQMAQAVLAGEADYEPREVEAALVWQGLNRTEKWEAAKKVVAAWREADADAAMWRQS